MEYVVWLLAGWCGTPSPRPIPIPRPDQEPPRAGPIPDPRPQSWVILKVVGAVGGIIGGLVFDRVFNGAPLPAQSLGWIAATSFGALIFGRVLSEVAGLAFGGNKANTLG